MPKKINQHINLKHLSKTEKIGQFFFPAAFINDSDAEVQKLERLIKDYQVGGLTFFHSKASAATNYEGKKKVIRNENSLKRLQELITHYQSISPTPLLISIDAEWGLAMRVENTPKYPYALTLGAIPKDQNELIFQVGKHIGKDLSACGIHLNLAPVADINLNPDNPVIGYRSFGEDKELVTEKALKWYDGLRTSGILGCFKHFPGHGDTNIDSHLGLPVISKSISQLYDQELYPFIKAIAYEIDTIMIGHLAVPALSGGQNISATLSKNIIKEVLRKELGFKGAIISDALNMYSVSKLYDKKGVLEWKAFDAGNDILCFAEHVEEGITMIEKKATNAEIQESLERILNLKKTVFASQDEKNMSDPEQIVTLNRDLAKASLTEYKKETKTGPIFKAGSFEGIVMGAEEGCTFFKELEKRQAFPKTSYSKELHSGYGSDNILIALFPPSVKPANGFGISTELSKWISDLSKTKHVALYLFGNPYVTRVLPIEDIHTIVLCYQNFETFQEVAAEHFLGKHQAIGKIPVQLYQK